MSHHKHLTINKREIILADLVQSKTIREITRNLSRASYTISREIKRHRNKNTAKYSPDKAQNNYKLAKSKCGRKAKSLENPYPPAPRQRGSNENTNGLLREYSPKGQSLDDKTDNEIQEIVNSQQTKFPSQKVFDWKTTYEVYFGKVLHLI